MSPEAPMAHFAALVGCRGRGSHSPLYQILDPSLYVPMYMHVRRGDVAAQSRSVCVCVWIPNVSLDPDVPFSW